ncbi:MAG: LysR family transcriptional regulator [Gammaproteobacteria bacterium]|nr:LysR family transcriptional regulator [Gammaproteobacteria bacterium]MBU1492036.1 LysR family transcriptional regulator [Gammaproteobacteria bacterium]MBU2065942.1 LysR family transcriptional regulator [Gammaproteobacteria bacterium]MBU2141268.1 LysR family transcriptional regulator [Gammaproteobacteria bacterium]MBU2215368.1 LysR family transcriptional regulator [Gammaproteobacteria bacterium]
MKEHSTPTTDRLELLHTFVRIVETGSLSAAAVQLGVSQPTVSRRLQVLERNLGLRLLQRSTHGMKLSDDGERCFAQARELLDSWDNLESSLKGSSEQARGTLRVLAPHAFGQDQLITPLLAYLDEYPEVQVEWLLHDRRPDFIAEGIDCAIQVGSVDDPNVVALHLAEVPRIVVAAPGIWGNGPAPLDSNALSALPWLALKTYYRDEVTLTQQHSGSVQRFAIRPRLSTDSLYALRNAALAGMGACIASSWIVADDLRCGRLVQLAPEWQAAPLPVYLVYPYARHYPARLRLFIARMRASMPNLSGMRAPG